MARKGDYAKMTPEQKAKHYRQIQEYQQKNTTTCNVRLHYENDGDIIAYLNSCSNKNGLIKYLIREYAAKHPIPEEF